VTLNWVAGQPGVASTLVGATSVAQLDVTLPADVASLDTVSYSEPALFPHNLFARLPANSTRRRPHWRPA
jgi:aryl-alcohol dehydrogenase-like predicted oxidoreductase